MPLHPQISTLEVETQSKGKVGCLTVGEVQIDVKKTSDLGFSEIGYLADVVQTDAYSIKESLFLHFCNKEIEVGEELSFVEHHRTEGKIQDFLKAKEQGTKFFPLLYFLPEQLQIKKGKFVYTLQHAAGRQVLGTMLVDNRCDCLRRGEVPGQISVQQFIPISPHCLQSRERHEEVGKFMPGFILHSESAQAKVGGITLVKDGSQICKGILWFLCQRYGNVVACLFASAHECKSGIGNDKLHIDWFFHRW